MLGFPWGAIAAIKIQAMNLSPVGVTLSRGKVKGLWGHIANVNMSMESGTHRRWGQLGTIGQQKLALAWAVAELPHYHHC